MEVPNSKHTFRNGTLIVLIVGALLSTMGYFYKGYITLKERVVVIEQKMPSREWCDDVDSHMAIVDVKIYEDKAGKIDREVLTFKEQLKYIVENFDGRIDKLESAFEIKIKDNTLNDRVRNSQ